MKISKGLDILIMFVMYVAFPTLLQALVFGGIFSPITIISYSLFAIGSIATIVGSM